MGGYSQLAQANSPHWQNLQAGIIYRSRPVLYSIARVEETSTLGMYLTLIWPPKMRIPNCVASKFIERSKVEVVGPGTSVHSEADIVGHVTCRRGWTKIPEAMGISFKQSKNENYW